MRTKVDFRLTQMAKRKDDDEGEEELNAPQKGALATT